MQNKTLLLISIIISIMGIIFLLILSYSIPPKKVFINQIDKSSINKNIKISGKISQVKNYKDFQIILVKDSTGEIEVFSDNKNKPTKEDKNQSVIIIGKVQEYKNRLQIKSRITYFQGLKLL